MYKLTDQQIDYILNDIRARGVEMESLQDDLLDHICCIVEQKLEATGDFESFYHSVIKTFYKKELKEIEDETISLLNNKNYYAMKKVMMASGIISAMLLTLGIVLKYLHQPGAAFGIVTGIVSFSLLFLPLMFMLKVKEKSKSKDKALLAIGSVVAILMSLAIMFKIQQWPGANVMGLTSVALLFLLYLPINLVTGIRNPETKTNTVISSILLVAGCGLFLSLARTPYSSKMHYVRETSFFVRNNTLFENEQQQVMNEIRSKNISISDFKEYESIIVLCDEIKSFIIEKETGLKKIDPEFANHETWLGETYVKNYFREDSPGFKKYQEMISKIEQLEKSNASKSPLLAAASFLSSNQERVSGALNNLVQVQMFVLQKERVAMQNF